MICVVTEEVMWAVWTFCVLYVRGDVGCVEILCYDSRGDVDCVDILCDD